MATPRTEQSPIAGYTYGTGEVERSPVSLEELELLRRTVGLDDEDERWLREAARVLVPQASEMVDEWRAVIAKQPHLAVYSSFPDGRPNSEYSAASKPRFTRWIEDVCTRPYDQDWLDYQHEIGLRHTRAKKNKTDGVQSAAHIPLRYVLAFAFVVISTTRRYLEGHGHSREQVERMHAAWAKAIMLHVTLWSRAYTSAEMW